MAYGDEQDGTLFLYEVPVNLRTQQEDEVRIINDFWAREIAKCNYVKERRVIRKEEYLEQQKVEEVRKALEEQAKEQHEDVELQRELDQEAQYQQMLLEYKAELGLISAEEMEALSKDKKKKK